MNIMVNNGISGIPWNTMEHQGIQWNTMRHNGSLRNTMEYHGGDYHGNPWNVMEYRTVPWNTVENRKELKLEYHGKGASMIADLSVQLWRPRAVGWHLDTSGMTEKQFGMTGV